MLAESLKAPEPRAVSTEGIGTILTVKVKAQDCAAILTRGAEEQNQPGARGSGRMNSAANSAAALTIKVVSTPTATNKAH